MTPTSLVVRSIHAQADADLGSLTWMQSKREHCEATSTGGQLHERG